MTVYPRPREPRLMSEPTKSVWDHVKTAAKWVWRVLGAPIILVLLVAGAVLLVSLGLKNVQIGGLIGALFGKKSPADKAIDVANSVPKGRVDADGKLIPIGTPDAKGMTQAAVVPIANPGLFSNPDTVVFTPPGAEKPIEVSLPEGVKANDVEHVVVVKPGKFVVTVKDSSGVTAKKVDDLLSKYGG